MEYDLVEFEIIRFLFYTVVLIIFIIYINEKISKITRNYIKLNQFIKEHQARILQLEEEKRKKK